MVKMGKDMQRSKDLSEGCIPEIHVLAVDDSNIDRKVIERLLKNFSYKVTAVDSAERALEILGIVEGCSSLSANAYQINLIITDYCMPDMTGFDLLKKVKETSSLKEIPVVIMSSENVPQRIKRCMAEGAEEFIMKPVQVADIKRLRGHVRRNTSTSEELIPTPNCPKRKLADGLGKAKPGRSRPRSLTVS